MRDRRERGFSLPEAMITMGIFALILGAAYPLLLSGQARALHHRDQYELRQRARVGTDRFSLETRQAGAGVVDHDPILRAHGHLISFLADLSPNGDAEACPSTGDPVAERITFAVGRGGLYRMVSCLQGDRWTHIAGPTPIVEQVDVHASHMVFFDAAGNPIRPASGYELTSAQRQQVRAVELRLALLETRGSDGAIGTGGRRVTTLRARLRFLSLLDRFKATGTNADN